MAMNKAEKALLEKLATDGALRWPTAAEPQPMTKAEIQANLVSLPMDTANRSLREQAAALGWNFNAYSERVSAAWSDGVVHGDGHVQTHCASQGMGRLYWSEADALLAMRWEMCRKFARQLRAVDARLERSTP